MKAVCPICEFEHEDTLKGIPVEDQDQMKVVSAAMARIGELVHFPCDECFRAAEKGGNKVLEQLRTINQASAQADLDKLLKGTVH